MRLIALTFTLALLAPPVMAASPSPSDVLVNAVDQIRLGFTRLQQGTAALENRVDALCRAPGEGALERARFQFGVVVEEFSRIEFVRFGPLSEDSRYERFLFWPDRKGIGLRQVQEILATRDETAAGEATLRKKSVAVQGLPALEYVLFGTGAEGLADGNEPFRCRYGLAIAGALATVGQETRDAWQDAGGIAHRFTAPNAEYPDFRTNREALEALVGVFAFGVEAIRDTRLLPFVGRDGAAPKPKSALFWRSGLTMRSVRTNFEGLADLFSKSGIGQATAEENLWVDNGARFEFSNALRAADAVILPLDRALADEKQRKALDYLVILTGSLQTLLGENLAAALGLSVGFSSLDGD